MMEIFEKRGRWCFRKEGQLFKFNTEAEAREALEGSTPEVREYESIEDAIEGEE